MIDKLYVMYEHGACVFEKVYYTRIDAMTDTQIFAGFLSAIGSFASEALGSGLQSILLQTGEKLAILRHESGMLGICVADARDHDKLIYSLLQKILERFYTIFKKEVDRQDASLIGKTKKFDREVDAILKHKTTSRADWKMILGIVISLGLLAVLTFGVLNHTVLKNLPISPIYFFISDNPLQSLQLLMFNFLGSSFGSILVLIMFFVSFLFFIPSSIGGFLSGDRNRGLLIGLTLTVAAYVTLFLASAQITHNIGLDLRDWFLSLSPLIFFLTLSVSYCAGYVAERLFLYSFPNKSKKHTKIENFLNNLKNKLRFDR